MNGNHKNKIGVSDIISWSVAIMGIVATIISAFISESTKTLPYIFIVVLVTELILGVLWTFVLIDRFKHKNELNELNIMIDNLKKEKETLQKEVDNKQKDIINQHEDLLSDMETIGLNMKNASKLYNELCARIPNISDASYRVLELIKNSGETEENLSKEAIVYALEEFINGLFDLYKIYSKNLLDYVVLVEEAYLSAKHSKHKISATIKLFNKPYYTQKDDKKNIIVYTAFRDKLTYDKKERTIGENHYTIGGNSAFLHCLQKDQFIINNVKKGSDNYLNEHRDFDPYYNCAVVVPIRTKLEDGSFKYFGYLCCDCLNEDNIMEVFDMQSANYLFALAKEYATYLEVIDFNWKDRTYNQENFPESFLGVVFKKTYHGDLVHS